MIEDILRGETQAFYRNSPKALFDRRLYDAPLSTATCQPGASPDALNYFPALVLQRLGAEEVRGIRYMGGAPCRWAVTGIPALHRRQLRAGNGGCYSAVRQELVR